MRDDQKMKTILSLEEAAEIADVHRDTVYRWIKKGTRFGKLPARQLPGGQWRIRLEDLTSWYHLVLCKPDENPSDRNCN